MVSGSYSFIDIAVLDPLRARLAEGDALAILDIGLERVIWANGPGCRLLGHEDVEAVMGAPSNLSPVARRQIAAAPGFPRMRAEVGLSVRMGGARPVGLIVSAVTLPDGEPAVLIAVPATHGASRETAEIARQAVSGFRDANSYAALVDETAGIAAASEGFVELGISAETLADLVDEVRDEEDRLVKRLISSRTGTLAAGMARLTDRPARHLLLVIEAEEEEEEEAPSEPDAVSGLAAVTTLAQPNVDEDETVEIAPVEQDSDVTGETPDSIEPNAADERDEAGAAHGEAGADTDEEPAPTTEREPEAQPVDDEAGEDEPESHSDPDEAEPTAADKQEPQAGNAEADEITTPSIPAELAEMTRPSAIRFVWRTDADGRFTTVSEEFATAVGVEANSLNGITFREIAARLGIDGDDEVAELLERRDTWSGRTVLWPIAGTRLRVPVDLAALPIYDRARNFEGFRGFGVARMADAAPFAAGAARNRDRDDDAGPAQADASADTDPFLGERPAIAVEASPERRQSDKIIRLAEHRPQNGQASEPAPDERGLSPSERTAFKQIGERLRRDSSEGPADDMPPKVDAPEAKDDRSPEPEAVAEPHVPADETPPEISGEREMSEEPVAQAPEPAESEPESEPEPVEDEMAAAGPEPETLEDKPEAVEPEPETIEPEPIRASMLDGLDPAPELERKDFPPSAFPAATVAAADPTSISVLLAGLPFPMLVHSGERLHFANREFLKLTGHDSVKSIADAGGIGGLFADGADPARQSGAMRLRRPDGTEIDVNAHLQSIAWNGGKALLLALRPAPEAPAPALPRDDDEMEDRLYELRAIIDTATDGIVLIDKDGLIRSISRPAEALFGKDSDRVEGQPFTSLFAIESQRAAADYLAGLADNGVASVLNDGREVIGREAQGRFIPLFMTMGRLPADGGYCAVLRDITNWKRVEEDLTQARAHAERASSQKTEFLARVSHEVRTPLNAIIGFSELMLDEKFGPIGNERYRDYLRDINRSGNHVLDLVNDLLDISKIEAGEQEMSYEAVSLNDALAESVGMMQPQANRERVIIRSSFASRLPDVVADQRSVRQIALNLLSNAVRATPAGGQVIVSTAYEPSGDIVARVRDTGIGMSLPEIEQALKPFKQINALKRARGEGTGLGLPLTKALVEANRARFNISSTPGQGTMVEVVFPSTRVLAE